MSACALKFSVLGCEHLNAVCVHARALARGQPQHKVSVRPPAGVIKVMGQLSDIGEEDVFEELDLLEHTDLSNVEYMVSVALSSLGRTKQLHAVLMGYAATGFAGQLHAVLMGVCCDRFCWAVECCHLGETVTGFAGQLNADRRGGNAVTGLLAVGNVVS